MSRRGPGAKFVLLGRRLGTCQEGAAVAAQCNARWAACHAGLRCTLNLLPAPALCPACRLFNTAGTLAQAFGLALTTAARGAFLIQVGDALVL